VDVRVVPNYLPIRRLSPATNPPDDWLVCVFKTYLDGSWSDGCIGLASWIATEREWDRFEREWHDTVYVGQRMPDGIHMRHFSQLVKTFAGKDRVQAEHAVSVAVNYLAGLHDWMYRRYSCVVKEDDYVRAQAQCPRLANKPIHAFLVNHCTGRIFTPRFQETGDPEANIHIIFDAGEKFMEHIHEVWRVEKDDSTSWARFVSAVTDINNSKNQILPMQAADVLAWVSRRQRALNNCANWFDPLCGQKRTQTSLHEFFDYDALMARYGPSAQTA
jgi:uncharacterized protein YlaI